LNYQEKSRGCTFLWDISPTAPKEDLFRIAANTNHEFGQMIAVVKAAELLELVDTPKRMVVLTDIGARYVEAGPDEGKAIWRQQLLTLRLFQEACDLVKRLGEVEQDQFVPEGVGDFHLGSSN
jgi:hypothetical protein